MRRAEYRPISKLPKKPQIDRNYYIIEAVRKRCVVELLDVSRALYMSEYAHGAASHEIGCDTNNGQEDQAEPAAH